MMERSPEFPIRLFAAYRKAGMRLAGILDIERDLTGKMR